MNYNIEDIEDQLICTLQNAMPDVSDIRTHSGEINILMFQDSEYMEGLQSQLPFVYVHYASSLPMERSSEGSMQVHQLKFMFYVGASSLRVTQEAQRACYGMLRTIYDSIHASWCDSVNTPASAPAKLSGQQILDTSFKQMTMFLRVAEDEKLMFQLPKIAVYQTSYLARFLA